MRRDHELLEIDGVVGVLPAVEHVHAGDWEEASIRTAQIAVQRQAMGTRNAARATAIDTARIAFAPNLALFGVASSPIMAASTAL